MTDELEKQLILAIKKGDLAATRVYSDYLEERGRGRVRYVVGIPEHEEPISEENATKLQAYIKEWLEGKVLALVLPPGWRLFLVTDKLCLTVWDKVSAIQEIEQRDRLNDLINYLEQVLELDIGTIDPVIAEWLDVNDCGIYPKSMTRE